MLPISTDCRKRCETGGGDLRFDVNNDGSLNDDDRVFWIQNLRNTWIGDSNLDGEFGTGDFVFVFQAAEYEDMIDGNSTWAEGDWNGDAEFDSGDFVYAFRSQGFEQGVRPAIVPEPRVPAVAFLACILIYVRRRYRMQQLRFALP